MKRIALLRSNPKDAALGKIVSFLTKKYTVECFVWDRQHDYVPIVANENVHYIRCTLRAGFYSVSTFLKLFLFELWLLLELLFVRVDCMHAIDLDTGFVGLCAAKLRGKTFVYQCLDPYYTVLPQGWPKFLANIAKWLENFVITRADLFVITDLLRMPQHEGAKPKKIVEVANVPLVDLSRLSGGSGRSFLIGYIGSLAEGRSLTTVVEAVGELQEQGVKMIIGGFGPLADTIDEAARHFANVTYTAWVPFERLYDLESSFDLFVYVTDKENAAHRWVSPNKLFESMAFGRPIIVGKGTLAAERVETVGNGITVTYGSKEELKKAILVFKEDPELAREMGSRGRVEFERKWLPEKMEKRFIEAYAGLSKEIPGHEMAMVTEKHNYTEHLVGLESWWKRLLDVQRPYRRHLQRLRLGFVLDIGCGLGRNLANLGGRGVGVDHNRHSVGIARSRGLTAFTPEEFQRSEYAQEGRFDSLLLAHVAEHMEKEDVVNLLRDYLVYLSPGGRVVIITPQESGFRSDRTHVEFANFDTVAAIAERTGLVVERQYSFPFPRSFGYIFKYNEFVTICRKQAAAATRG